MQKSILVFAAAGLLTAGCIDLSGATLLPVGTPFVVTGTATVIDTGEPCLVWLGDNGVTYHLFQDPLLQNESFDVITEPGTTSRLVVVTRTDLEVGCETGTIVEVQEVLEIVE